MAGNVPNVSKDSFDWSKLYDAVVLQQGVPIVDSDWNEMNDILQVSMIMQAKILFGNTALEEDGTSVGYSIAEASSPSNNFEIGSGWAVVEGVLVPTTAAAPPLDHDYEDDTNVMCEGILSAAASITLTDNDKYWQSFYGLVGCRVKMTSGVESGNEFPITANPSATTIECSGGIGSIAPGDGYIIKPPVLTTPGGARTDEVYVMAWFEDINENEDPDIINAGIGIEASHRRQRRWCVRVAENGTTPSTPFAYGFGVRYLKLAELARTATADVTSVMITNEPFGGRNLNEFVKAFSEESIPWNLVPSVGNTYDLGSAANPWKDLRANGTSYISAISGSLIPVTDDAFDLGSVTNGWKEGHFTDDVIIGGSLAVSDANLGLSIVSSNPRLTFDADDYFEYNRSANLWTFYVNSFVAMTLDSGTLAVPGGDIEVYDTNFRIYAGVNGDPIHVGPKIYFDRSGGDDYMYYERASDLFGFRSNGQDILELTPTLVDIKKATDIGGALEVSGAITTVGYSITSGWDVVVTNNTRPAASGGSGYNGTNTYYWGWLYTNFLYYKTMVTFDTYDDLELIRGCKPDFTVDSVEVQKGGSTKKIQPINQTTIPWPMLGEQDDKGEYFLNGGDSIMFLLGGIKQLDSLVQGLVERLEALEAPVGA